MGYVSLVSMQLDALMKISARIYCKAGVASECEMHYME